MDLRIEVSISDYQSGGNLRLSEQVTIPEADFDVMAQILAKFHEALTAVKEARQRA